MHQIYFDSCSNNVSDGEYKGEVNGEDESRLTSAINIDIFKGDGNNNGDEAYTNSGMNDVSGSGDVADTNYH